VTLHSSPPPSPPGATPWYDNPFVVYTIAAGGSLIGYLVAGVLIIVFYLKIRERMRLRQKKKEEEMPPVNLKTV
jgi:hypothetical protein